MNQNIVRGLVAAGVLVTAGAANAAVDIASITAAATDVGTVGVAVFALMVGIKVFHWIRRAL